MNDRERDRIAKTLDALGPAGFLELVMFLRTSVPSGSTLTTGVEIATRRLMRLREQHQERSMRASLEYVTREPVSVADVYAYVIHETRRPRA